MRALTHGMCNCVQRSEAQRNNEILAREGIDTNIVFAIYVIYPCNNEILAREGIDTIRMITIPMIIGIAT